MLACIIFSLFAASPPAVDPNAAAVTQVWSYVGELLFNMLILVGRGQDGRPRGARDDGPVRIKTKEVSKGNERLV